MANGKIITSRCQKCQRPLYARDILKHLKSIGQANTLKEIKCGRCGASTQVMDKPYIQKENRYV